MSLNSGEKYSYLQVERPVLYGAEDFLAQARHIGELVIGHVIKTSVTVELPGETDDGAITLPKKVLEPVREPLMQVVPINDLKVILLHRRAAKSQASKYSFGYHYNSLSTKREPVYPESAVARESKYVKRSLYQQLTQVSRDFQVDPDELPVSFDRVDVIERTEHEVIFGLFPKAESLAAKTLRTQESVCERRIFQQSRAIADADGQSDNQGIRFASVPTSVPRAKVDEALELMQHNVPVRLVLGRPDARAKDSRGSDE